MADKQVLGSFHSFRKRLRGIFHKTSEPAEEVKMETQDAVQTEQPAAPSSVQMGPGQPTKDINPATKLDGKKVVDPTASVNEAKATKASGSTEAAVDGPGDKVGVTDKTVKVADGDDHADKPAQEKEKKVDRLERLAQQIEEFDPVAILNRKTDAGFKPASTSSVSPEFSRDINDEKLIDELVENVSESVDEVKINDDDDNEVNEREITPESEEDNSAGIDTSADSNIDTKPDDQVDANGCVSDEEPVETNGIDQDKDVTAEVPTGKTAEKEEIKVAEVKSTKKQESSSPTKSGKSKRKEDKSIDHILKALSSLHTSEEKLAALCKKYADLHEDHRVLQTTLKQGQRKLTVISREKDQLQTEHTKAVMAKSKLEGLCRELQKHNQTVRQESLQRAREEDEKRKEISQKFQTTIGEIQTQMQENHEKNKHLSQENYDLATKLKKFIEQYEAREKQIEKLMQHRELEQKLADAKLEQATAILMEEKAKNQKEKELLLMQTTEYVKKLQIKEAELSMYKERYEEFQSTIKKSEEMFQKFKTEMDKMTKRCKKLEKDGVVWKQKWENANRALLEMATEMKTLVDKTKYDKERPMLLNKISKLESLCRAMQAERKARKILEADGIDISKLTVDEEESFDELSKEQTVSESVNTASASSGSVLSPDDPDTTTEGEPESDNKSDTGTFQSSASENTDVTVIQQDSPPGDTTLNNGTVSQSAPVEPDSQSAPEKTNQPEQLSETTAS